MGANVSPVGPRSVRALLEVLFLVLCIADIGIAVIVLVNSFCASENTTQCTNHTSMLLMILVWPGALIIAPVTGLATVILGPSGQLARIYALWSRIALINSAMVVLALVSYQDYFQNVPGGLYLMLVLPSSRGVQCVCVDAYIAHVEKMRYTRGWDGLHTSLFKTTDNRQEIAS
ncbi:hypothetical protein B484DRAFT_456946 [Ochromonadaceae sp. CCMP2298]|nr:hypothetical protein B484DRAFT_456946 [Ochromonadaceae sp. CCMP2298]